MRRGSIRRSIRRVRPSSAMPRLSHFDRCPSSARMRSERAGKSFWRYRLNHSAFDQAAAQRRRGLLVLAGKIVFAGRAADAIERFERLWGPGSSMSAGNWSIQSSPDSALEEAGFRTCMGLFLSSSRFGCLLVLCSERESRSSFFNRAAGVKKVVHSGLRSSVNTLVARHWRNAVSLFG
jgi:hypothetical protein